MRPNTALANLRRMGKEIAMPIIDGVPLLDTIFYTKKLGQAGGGGGVGERESYKLRY